MRKISLPIGILLIASLLLSACGGVRRQSGILRIGWVNTPDSFNPGKATSEESFRIFDMVYDTLYKLNINREYQPELTDKVTVSEDGLKWRFNIRNGVMFHDGQPLTAKDVVFSYNFYLDNAKAFPYLASFMDYFDSVKLGTTTEVVITLTRPISNMENRLSHLYVLPEHVWAGAISTRSNGLNFLRYIVPDYWQSADTVAAVDYENLDMIGSGPFKMVDYQPGSLIKLEAVKNHYFYQPKVDGIEIVIYKEPSLMIKALQNGEVDMISSVPVAAVAAIMDMPNIKVVHGPSLSPKISDIIMNQISPANCPQKEGWVCTGHPALRDHFVRQALFFAVDRQRIVDDIMNGYATTGLTLIPRGLGNFYNESVIDYGYNVNQANAILDKQGYKDTNGDGIREMPDGSLNLEFRLSWPSNIASGQKEAELLKFMWSQIGVSVDLKPLDPTLLNSRCCPTFDYDIMINERVSDPDPAVTLGTEYTGNITTGLNETGYSNLAYDSLYTRQLVKIDQTDRLNTILLMQYMLYSDFVYIVPFYSNTIQAYRTDTFTGWPFTGGNLALENPFSLATITSVPKQ